MQTVHSLSGCGPGALPWVEKVFGDCLYDGRDLLGFCCGMASICCWLVAQIPQLYRNYTNKSAEALSPWFLAEWLLGDTFNLLGALLKGDQLPTVVFTAQYFIGVDVVMMVQYIYYISLQRRRERMLAERRHRHHHHHRRRRHGDGADGGMQQQSGSGAGGGMQQQSGSGEQPWGSNGSQREGRGPHTASDGSRGAVPLVLAIAAGAGVHGDQDAEIGVSGSSSHTVALGGARDASFRPQRTLACLGTLLMLAHFQEPQSQLEGKRQQAAGGRRLLLMASIVSSSSGGLAAHLPDWTYTAGTVLGYCSSVLYLTSRLSQIYRNHKRQSVEGLAISMFVTAIAANTCYGASILIRSTTWPELRSSLPWLIGSLGTVSLDAVIFVQARMFGTVSGSKQHPSDEDELLLATP